MPITKDRHYYDRYYNALVTPFKPDSLEIDYDALRKHIRHFVQDERFVQLKGSFIANPEAAEMFYFTKEERQNTLKIVLEERGKDMPVFSGVFGVTVDEAIECALEAKKLGADGLFIFPPTGTCEVGLYADNVKSPEIWTDWVKAIDKVVDLPIIVHPVSPYNAQWAAALPLPTVKSLAENVPNLVGYKMIYGNERAHNEVARYFRSIDDKDHHIAILNGSVTNMMLKQVDGTVLGSWNWAKEAMLDEYEAYRDKDWDKMAKAIAALGPWNAFVGEGGTRIHIRYKLSTWLRGLCAHPFMRPPMPPPHIEEAKTLLGHIKNAGLSHIDEKEIEPIFSRAKEIIATGIHVKG
jgi:dihydrodipicolinate synthase/N-acetylneuraminate lyase